MPTNKSQIIIAFIFSVMFCSTGCTTKYLLNLGQYKNEVQLSYSKTSKEDLTSPKIFEDPDGNIAIEILLRKTKYDYYGMYWKEFATARRFLVISQEDLTHQVRKRIDELELEGKYDSTIKIIDLGSIAIADSQACGWHLVPHHTKMLDFQIHDLPESFTNSKNIGQPGSKFPYELNGEEYRIHIRSARHELPLSLCTDKRKAWAYPVQAVFLAPAVLIDVITLPIVLLVAYGISQIN